MHGIDPSKVTHVKQISPKGDKVKISYFEDGQPLKAYDFDSKLGKQCAGLQTIVKDLEIVVATLKLLLTMPLTGVKTTTDQYITFKHDDSEHLILSSLITSSIVTYAKHFTKGNGLSPLIPSDKIRQALDEELFSFHQKILNLRHNWIAHGGINNHELAKTVVLVDSQRKGSFTFLHHVHFATSPLANEVELFIKLAESSLKMIREILSKRSDALWNKEISLIPLIGHAKKSKTFVTFSNSD